MKVYTLKVQDVIKETADAVTICFKQPNLKKVKYQAGQYLSVVLRINGRRYIRAYSFSSSPSLDKTLNITVKRVLGGIMSNYINDSVKVDDVIEVLEPIGKFIHKTDSNIQTITFWGVGSGITPLYSIIRELLATDELVVLNLIYGNKRKGDALFFDEIEKLQQDYSNRFKVYHFLSQEKEIVDSTNRTLNSRISKEFVTDYSAQFPFSKHYICGPLAMKEMIIEELVKNQCAEDRIYFENFELVKNPEDFKNIVNQKVVISFNGIDTEVEVIKGNSILEEALELNIELPYSCQTGSCSTCKATLLSGELQMIGLDKPRTDLNSDEFLLCCSYPLSENVKLSI